MVYSRLYSNCQLQQHDSIDCIFRVNGSDTDLRNVHVGTGNLTNLSDEVTVSDGDLFCFANQTQGSGGQSRLPRAGVMNETPNKLKRHAVQHRTGHQEGTESWNVNDATEFLNVMGRMSSDFTESRHQIRVRGTQSAVHIWCHIISNSRGEDSTLLSRVNFADGGGLVTVTGSTSGKFEDLSGGDDLLWGDGYCLAGRTVGGGGTVTVESVGCDFVDYKGRLGLQGLGRGQSQNHSANQTRLTTLESNFQLAQNFNHDYSVGYRQTAGFLHAPIAANANTAAGGSTIAVSANSDTTSVAINIPPLTSGDFENLTDTLIVRETQTYNGMLLQTGSSGGNLTYDGLITWQTTSAPRFKIEPRAMNTAPDGTPLGMGQPVCIQIGGDATVAAAPPAGALALGGLLPTIHEVVGGVAEIIEVPAGHFCLRGPIDISVVDIPIPVPVGGLTFAGLTPARVISINRAIPVGTLVFAGQAAVRSIGVSRAPGAGTLVFAGQAPVRLVVELRSPGVGALVFAGLAPLRVVGIIRAPGAGALVFVGETPVRFVVELRAPGAGALVLGGLAPLLGFEVHPGAGSLVFAGLAPLANVTVLRAVPVGALVLTGQGTGLGFELHPGVGTLVLAGLTPLAFRQRVFAPGAGSLVFAGQTPLRLIDDLTPVPAGALVFAGQAPVAFVQRFIPVPAGALVFQGQLPIITSGTLRQPGVGGLVLQGQTPVRFVEELRAPAAGTLLFAGQALTLGFELHPGAGVLLLGSLTPLRLVDDPTPVPVGSLVLGGLAPVLALAIPIPVGALVFAGLASLRLIDKTIPIPAGTLLLAGQNPAAFVQRVIPIPAGSLVFSSLPISLAFVCPAPVGALTLAGLLPTVTEATGAKVLEPGVGALVFQGLLPTVTSSKPPIDVPVGALALAGLAPARDITVLRTPAAGSLVFVGELYSLPPSAGVGLGALVLAGLVPTILQPRTALMGVADLRFTGQLAVIPGALTRGMLPGPMAFGGQTPILDFELHPVAGTLLFTGRVVSLTQLNVTPPGELVFEGHAPLVLDSSPTPGPGDGIPTGTLVFAGLAPTITAGGVVGGDVATAMPVGACVFAGHVPRVSVFTADPMNPTNLQTICIRRERQGTFITEELGWIFTHMIQLDLETGIGLDGLASLPGHDPQIEMQYSDDNARTWSQMRPTSGGKIGKHRTRAIWRRLGRSRKRLYRIRLCDPVKWAIVDAYARWEKGTS
jgi:hypothetical protein